LGIGMVSECSLMCRCASILWCKLCGPRSNMWLEFDYQMKLLRFEGWLFGLRILCVFEICTWKVKSMWKKFPLV
jgi:hypothetical protein